MGWPLLIQAQLPPTPPRAHARRCQPSSGLCPHLPHYCSLHSLLVKAGRGRSQFWEQRERLEQGESLDARSSVNWRGRWGRGDCRWPRLGTSKHRRRVYLVRSRWGKSSTLQVHLEPGTEEAGAQLWAHALTDISSNPRSTPYQPATSNESLNSSKPQFPHL